MSREMKNKVVSITVIVLFLGISLLCWLKPADEFSNSERRKLEQFPKYSIETLLSGRFMKDFEDYTLDQFPFRERFRQTKAIFASSALRQGDNNGIYVSEGYVSQMDAPLREESVRYAAQRFQSIYEKYWKDMGSNMYVSVIPDKNYFMAEKSGHLSLNYETLFQICREEMKDGTFIDLTGLLSMEDFYKTDTHWRQECVTDVAETLLQAMGRTSTVSYEEQTLEQPFYGVYYGQAALPLPAEEIHYLTTDLFENCRIYDHENNREIGMYDFEKGHGKDPYELFLSGSLSMITIENPKGEEGKELVIFRDSFASSLTPLLAEGYQKITLLDIRYLHPDRLEQLMEIKDQDVLFLYSTMVLNHAETIK